MWIMSNYQLKPRHQVKRFSTHFRKVYTLDFFHEWIHPNDAICEVGDTCSKKIIFSICVLFLFGCHSKKYPKFCSSNRPASFHLPRESRVTTPISPPHSMRQETPPFQIQLPAAEGISRATGYIAEVVNPSGGQWRFRLGSLSKHATNT